MASDVELSQWCSRNLSQILDCNAGDEVTEYLLNMQSAHDIEEYLSEFLDKNDPIVKQFIRELLRRWSERNKDDIQVYKKPAEESLMFIKAKENVNPEKGYQSSQKKTSKFVPLHSQEGLVRQSVKLPGRLTCECQAQKHALINNCTECGRVVCEQEGSGPCFFCGTLVCTPEEQEILARDSKKSQKLKEKLMNQRFEESKPAGNKVLPNMALRMTEGLEKALKHKNKLLDYDKTSAQRTQVIDDESDYFATDSNMWLSKRERQALKVKEEELRDLKHKSRLQLKVTLDFAGRQVLDENESYSGVYDKRSVKGIMGQNDGAMINPSHSRQRPEDIRPMFTAPESESKAIIKNRVDSDIKKNTKNLLRIQDRELMEMSDQGMCLSMHQPWASLLVRGIKKVEGRTWYTAHRGPLWIAATVKNPTPEEIKGMEMFYRSKYPGEVLDFPKDYPTGCLLGCVDVTDCLEEEEYKLKFPNGESESNYVFIVENPRELKFKFQVKGKHKIWRLDSHIHAAAKKTINCL